MSLAAIVPAEMLLVARCGHRSALVAAIPRVQWHLLDVLQSRGLYEKQPLPRFYWGAEASDWSGNHKP